MQAQEVEKKILLQQIKLLEVSQYTHIAGIKFEIDFIYSRTKHTVVIVSIGSITASTLQI